MKKFGELYKSITLSVIKKTKSLISKSITQMIKFVDSNHSKTKSRILLTLLSIDLPDEVATEVSERGGCEQFMKRIEVNMYKNDRVYALRAMATMLPKVEKARENCLEKEFQV